MRFRLARRLFLVVFAAIVLIEFIIVIPSYHNYQSSLLSNYRELARIATSAAEAGSAVPRVTAVPVPGTQAALELMQKMQ